MKSIVVAAALGLAALPLHAQDNPFKQPKNKIDAVQVSYSYSGDMQGTAERAISQGKVMSRETTTAKMFGKTSTTDRWTLSTPDWSYNADLTNKTGTKYPNVLPYMEKAYDRLDGASKQRLTQNLHDMAQIIARAFGAGALSAGPKGETKTIAGEKCDEHAFAGFSVCSMKDAPEIPLHLQGDLFCVNFEETATAVKRTAPPASAFEPPAGINFQSDTNLAHPDSMAKGFVTYLASQQLTDSLAKAKAEMAKQQPAAASSSNGGGSGQSAELTPEQKEQQRKSCEQLRNFDLGKTMANATKSVVSEALNEVKQEKEAEAKDKAKDKIKGLFKKPHI